MTALGLARRLWHRIETVHAITYFAPVCRDAASAAGLRGFWMGYFANRAAPLGPAPAAVVEATFYNFAPSMVRRSIPDAWMHAEPLALVESRAAAAASVLCTCMGGRDEAAEAVHTIDGMLAALVSAGSPSGRPLFAANKAIPTFDDPVARLWQACTTLREHRGDGHVATLLHGGLDGVGAHLLQIGAGKGDLEAIEASRGWTPEDWSVGRQRMLDAGLLDPGGGLSSAGRLLHDDIENDTDRLAAETLDALDTDDTMRVLAVLDVLRMSIVDANVVPFPNPMGLPSAE